MLIEREQAETDLLACASFVAERIGNTDGHAATIADLARHYAAQGELDLAAGLADEIRDPHQRDALLSEIAARCADFNDDEYGLQLAEAIEDYGFQQQALHHLAARQAANGRFNDALLTAEQTIDPVAAFGDIAVHLARRNDETRARELIEQIDLPAIRVQVFNEIAAVKIKRGEAADTVLLESLTESEQIEFGEERTQLLLEIAERFHQSGNNERAAVALEGAKQAAENLERRFRDGAFVQIALLFARLGNFAQAESTLKPIKDQQQIAEGHVGIAIEYFSIENHEAALSHLAEAYDVLKSQPAREVRDSAARFNLFATIAIRFAQFGNPERALEIALENPDEDARRAALQTIAAVAVDADKNELAQNALNAIDDYGARVFALVAASDAAAKKGEREKSGQFLAEAHSLSEEVAQLNLRGRNLNEIAVRYADADEAERARQILLESLQTAQKIVDQSQQAAALIDLAETYQKLDLQPETAEQEILKSIVYKRLN